MKTVTNKFSNIFDSIMSGLSKYKEAIVKGDLFVKLSFLWMGAGYFRRKQYIKSLIITLFEIAVLVFTFTFAIQYVPKFGTLGTVKQESVFNPITMQKEFNNYDNSFQILLFSLVSFIVWAIFLVVYIRNIYRQYQLQLDEQNGKAPEKFKDYMNKFLNSKFHITLLALPVLGISLFIIIPLIAMIFVAFTNYDQKHMPPTELFTWVGFNNFVQLFGGGGITSTFGYAFVRVLIWTLVWAVFATFTTYIGGILLASLINNKRVKLKKMWRTLFVITIAVPQFVSLLLVKNFFADGGIVNTICANIGLIDWLRDIGMINTTYIPFLTSPGWAHVMVILINIWVGVPYQMLIATGVLMNLPNDQIESARMDGANSFQIFRHITMPYVLFITGPALVTDFVRNINNFNVIFLLTNNTYTTSNQALANSQAKEIDLLVTWLFTLTRDNYNYKMAAVIGIVVFVISAVCTLVVFKRLTSGDKEGAYR